MWFPCPFSLSFWLCVYCGGVYCTMKPFNQWQFFCCPLGKRAIRRLRINSRLWNALVFPPHRPTVSILGRCSHPVPQRSCRYPSSFTIFDSYTRTLPRLPTPRSFQEAERGTNERCFLPSKRVCHAPLDMFLFAFHFLVLFSFSFLPLVSLCIFSVEPHLLHISGK